MLFSLSVPSGTSLALLSTFLLLGVTGVAVTLRERSAPLTIAAAVHALAGALAVLAADLITLLVAWELMTFSAYAVIRAGRQPGSERASYWYLAAQIAAAALFFTAMVIHVGRTGSLAVTRLHTDAQPVILAAVLVKTAMMPVHGWLVGAYTRASPAGSIVLSVYATKVGVYTAAVLAGWAPGAAPVLSIVGASVAVAAVAFALVQHSARRLLSYHIVSQVGYMLAGVGMAGIAGAGAAGVTAGLFHAVNHIIYKALLFMVVAAVTARVGHDDLRRTGGLWRAMPLAFVCAVIGAAAISGVPFTSGYASKELLKNAVGDLQGWLLTAASVGTGLSFIKFVYLLFIRPGGPPAPAADRGPAAPLAVGMVTLAALSVLIGVAPWAVPGVPAHRFYGSAAVFSAAWPLAAAAIVWAVVRVRLVAALGRAGSVSPVRDALLAAALRVLRPLRRAHGQNPQLSVGVAVVATLVIVGLLLLYG